jgi:23S rRNA (uracil1939-C5)-methyltransferase
MNALPEYTDRASGLLTVKLEKLTYGGDALGRLPDSVAGTGGRAVFVPFGLPGETVLVRVVDEKRGHVRAGLVEVLEPSPERITPRCKHFFTPLAHKVGEEVRACGGCHYQHMPYEAQLKVKTEILCDQLIRIGKISNPPVEPMVPSSREWNYRNHVQFHLTREGKLGYIDSAGRNVLPISECHLPEPAINELWPALEFDPGLGLQRVSLRLGADEERMLVLASDNPETPEMELEADLSVVHLSGDDAVVMAGDESLFITVNNRSFRVSAASFFQVNTEMAGKMASHLLEQLPVSSISTLLDVYCGVGLFSAFFAPRAGRLIGIESSKSSCEDFVANLDEFDNVELYEALAEEALPVLKVTPDAVIVDPPRTGLDKRVLDALLAIRPDRIAYVSCDPSTLGRDAARLIAGGYRLARVTPFDLFPQTYHIESISIFGRT